MQKEKKHAGEVTLEVINEIFLEDTPEYHHIKELAEQDIAKEILDRIDKFLEHKNEPEVEEIKKVVFEDASKVSDTNINDIVDAFVRIRSGESMENVDRKSINDILILFNQWVALGNSKQEVILPKDIFNEPVRERKQEKLNDLEEQLISFRETAHEELYKMHSPVSATTPAAVYAGPDQRIYDMGNPSEFICCPDHDMEGYQSKSIYKSHGGRVNTS
jgi:hypothetical protein